jgi:hypothetical protein
MAKTTRRSVTKATTAKPATGRKRLVDESAPVEEVVPRRRTATAKKATRVVATAHDTAPVAAAQAIPAEPTHEEVSLRAYHIYLRRGRTPGNPDYDWMQALNELRAERC